MKDDKFRSSIMKLWFGAGLCGASAGVAVWHINPLKELWMVVALTIILVIGGLILFSRGEDELRKSFRMVNEK